MSWEWVGTLADGMDSSLNVKWCSWAACADEILYGRAKASFCRNSGRNSNALQSNNRPTIGDGMNPNQRRGCGNTWGDHT